MASKDTKPPEPSREVESEDLFGFDKLGEPAAAAPKESSGSSPLASMADGIDLEELVAALPDLGLTRESEAELAGARAEEEEEEPLAEEPEPASEAEDGAEAAPLRFSPALLVVLVAVTLLNIAAVGLTWRTSRKLERTVSDVGRDVINTAEDIRDETAERSREIEQLVQPIVAPDSAEDQSLKWAQEDLALGDFTMARKRLYGLLAVIDSFDERIRTDVEARASFLLADSLLLEAQARREEQP